MRVNPNGTRSLVSAVVAFITWLVAAVLAGVSGMETSAAVALGLTATVLVAAKRLAASDAWAVAVATVFSAGAVMLIADSAAREVVFEAPRYIHGGELGLHQFFETVILVVTTALLASAASFLLAHLVAHYANIHAARGLGAVAIVGLAVLGGIGASRAYRFPVGDEWAKAQPLVFDADRAHWVSDPIIEPKGPITKHATIDPGITIRAECPPLRPCEPLNAVFPSGVEASAFAMYRVQRIRHSARERLWIIESEHASPHAIFEDSGHPTGDLTLKRIAGSVAPPPSYLVVFLVGLALSTRHLWLARRRRARDVVVGEGPYRQAVAPPQAEQPAALLHAAMSAGIACVAAAPMLGWWNALLR